MAWWNDKWNSARLYPIRIEAINNSRVLEEPIQIVNIPLFIILDFYYIY